MIVVTEQDGSRWVELDEIMRIISSRFDETCDCDRTTIHDCTCPHCRLRFLFDNTSCAYCCAGLKPEFVNPLMGNSYWGHLVMDYGGSLKQYEKCKAIK